MSSASRDLPAPVGPRMRMGSFVRTAARATSAIILLYVSLFVLIFFENLMPNPRDRGINEYNYKSGEIELLPFVISKALRDTVLISEKHLKYIENKNDYCNIRVFEKN